MEKRSCMQALSMEKSFWKKEMAVCNLPGTDISQNIHLQPNLDASSSDLQTQIHLLPGWDNKERCL